MQTQDIFYHPSESYLIFEGRLTKADCTAYVNDDVVTITNNGKMHLFSNINYRDKRLNRCFIRGKRLLCWVS